jgi:DNA modification methylase
MGAPYYQDDTVRLFHGDCLDVLTELPDASVDAVVTDPPYGLEFMGKEWDSFKTDRRGVTRTTGIPAVPGVRGEWSSGRPQSYDAGKPFQSWCGLWTAECLRVLKPGGHLLAFGGTRTWHRLACAVEDAGFEVRDSIAYLYGSGFPKSLNPYRSIMGACQNSANAPHVVRISKFIPVPSSAGREPIALALARIQPGDAPVLLTETGGAANSSARTATSLSALAERMNLSTDSLWNVLWDASSGRASMSTTSTTSRTTTVSAILSSLPSKTTPANTTTDPNLPRGCSCAAFTAGLGLSGISTGSNVIPVLTAPESATGGPLEPLKGFGTSAKPAFEPIVVARKPLQGTVAANVQKYGTGGLNIDGCRIGTGSTRRPLGKPLNGGAYGSDRDARESLATVGGSDSGRWPANVILDEDQAAALDEQSGTPTSGGRAWAAGDTDTDSWRRMECRTGPATRGEYSRAGDAGGASRFFYTAKADQAERITHNGIAHPTVKPLDLMRWLVRLVSPPQGGLVVDPFAGSGTTVEAAILEGFRCIAIERESDYLPLITQRIHRRRDPVKYLTAAGDDLGLFADEDVS